MKTGTWLSFVVFVVGSLLIGCGGGTSKSVGPDTNALAGNWLIVGPMPSNEFILGQPVKAFQLAMTFDVNGNNVVGQGSFNMPCNNNGSSSLSPVSVSGESEVEGTIASDGSFSAVTPKNIPFGMSILGKLPPASGGVWPGSYTVAATQLPTGVVCTGGFSGSFTATSFPLVSGVYAGTGSSPESTPGAQGTPVSFQVTLKQGGMVVNPTTGIASPSSIVLAGSIQVEGASCFSSGITNASPSSSVQGNLVNAVFSMDDGSTLNLQGALTDATEDNMSAGFANVMGGKCSGFYQLPGGLNRQGMATGAQSVR